MARKTCPHCKDDIHHALGCPTCQEFARAQSPSGHGDTGDEGGQNLHCHFCDGKGWVTEAQLADMCTVETACVMVGGVRFPVE